MSDPKSLYKPPKCNWVAVKEFWWIPKIRGTFFGGPYSKDYSILGSILGSPYLGKLPFKISYCNQETPLITFYP